MSISFNHSELGLVQLRTRSNVCRQIIKITQNLVIITVPPGFEDSVFPLSQDTIEKILQLRGKVVARSGDGRFKLDEPIETFTFTIKIGYQTNPRLRIYSAYLDGGVLQISMPVGVEIDDNIAQKALQRIVLKFLRQEAERVLPEKMEYWSNRCQLLYKSLKIDTAKSRWGCCSSRKDIKLSCYLLLLPERLIDYVIVHELCHTREMNHGPRFKALLHSFFNDYAAIELAKPKWDRKVSWLKL
jgi:predicted metal-dependent hydrolase